MAVATPVNNDVAPLTNYEETPAEELAIAMGSATSASTPRSAVAISRTEDAQGNWVDATGQAWVPKKLWAQYTNPDGIKCATIMLSLTSGCVEADNSAAEVELTEDGTELAVAEKFGDFMISVNKFYDEFAYDPTESLEERMRRRFAMEDDVRNMQATGKTTSIYRMTTPFRADKSSMRVVFCGSNNGGRYVHVDLSEKKKAKKQHVVMMSKRKKTVKAEVMYSELNL